MHRQQWTALSVVDSPKCSEDSNAEVDTGFRTVHLVLEGERLGEGSCFMIWLRDGSQMAAAEVSEQVGPCSTSKFESCWLRVSSIICSIDLWCRSH